MIPIIQGSLEMYFYNYNNHQFQNYTDSATYMYMYIERQVHACIYKVLGMMAKFEKEVPNCRYHV